MKQGISGLFDKWLPIVEDGVIDVLRVADMHRRHAYKPSDDFIVREISETFYKFSCAFTHLGDEKPLGHRDHAPVVRMLAVYLSDLAIRAGMAGAKEILLPVEPETPWAQFISELAQNNQISVKLRFSQEPYNLDLSYAGKTDLAIRSNPLFKDPVTDATVRGLWNIDDALKYKWDAEVRTITSAHKGSGRRRQP